MFVYGTEATRRSWPTALIVKLVADVIADAVFDASISGDVGRYLMDVVEECRLRADWCCDNEEKSWNGYGWLEDPHGCFAWLPASISSRSHKQRMGELRVIYQAECMIPCHSIR